jgi:hypothetical protein
MIRARHLEVQTEQVWCLTLATNAVIAWTTVVVRARGRADAPDWAANRRRGPGHISPAYSENINFFGAIEVDIDAELEISRNLSTR